MRRTSMAIGLCVAVALGFASPARAALLTITDNFGGSNTIWTLDVAAGCTTNCTVTLTANFQDPDGGGAGVNAYAGTFIDSVQWTIAGTDPTAVTILTAPGGTLGDPNGDWVVGGVNTNLSANQCSGGAADNVCVQTSNTAGFGPIVNGTTLTWTFSETFALGAGIPTNPTSGNIRAAFNDANGGNVNIFSPGGGTFGTGAGGAGGQPLVPEPTSLLLFGSGLSMVAYRARRRKQNQKKD